MSIIWPSPQDIEPHPTLLQRAGRVLHWMLTGGAALTAFYAYQGYLIPWWAALVIFVSGRGLRYIFSGE